GEYLGVLVAQDEAGRGAAEEVAGLGYVHFAGRRLDGFADAGGGLLFGGPGHRLDDLDLLLRRARGFERRRLAAAADGLDARHEALGEGRAALGGRRRPHRFERLDGLLTFGRRLRRLDQRGQRLEGLEEGRSRRAHVYSNADDLDRQPEEAGVVLRDGLRLFERGAGHRLLHQVLLDMLAGDHGVDA